MANRYTQLYIHIVFAPTCRQALISPDWEESLHKYITGIVQQRGHKMLAINGMPDHIHLLIGYEPTESLSDLIRETKRSSTDWVKVNRLCPMKFSWQSGYGAFSHSRSQISQVARYIENQKEHHRKRSFREEYLKMLHDFEVKYDERYLFDFLEG
jgi:putative transposase